MVSLRSMMRWPWSKLKVESVAGAAELLAYGTAVKLAPDS